MKLNNSKTEGRLQYKDYPDEPVAVEKLSVKFMKQARFVPVNLDGDELTIAMADTSDTEVKEAIEVSLGYRIRPVKGKPEDIADVLDRLYGSGTQSIEAIIEEADGQGENALSAESDDVEHLKDLASEAPIIRLVNRLIHNALELRASDIHFEPFDNSFQIRYRIDGVLHEIERPPARLQAAIISRVKIMARLDIAERRLPQDGNIKLKISDREIDFRVSTIPTIYGESVVMRILDRESLVLNLKQLGFPDDIYQKYVDLVRNPYGMVLVTGPTGSGKTSTLYTTLSMINSTESKIITLEDPVEYQLRNINQIQVKPKIGMTFSRGLRSIVRQDPDIILVGEIRDAETAEIAIQSALTGHLLFSTLHTNDSAGAITRLLDMGVEHFLLSSTLLGILAQRLVRIICPDCKERTTPEDRLVRAMNLSDKTLEQTEFYHGSGCEACHHTGFKGRTAIFEYLPVNNKIRREIVNRSSTETIKQTAQECGVRTLRQDGWKKVEQGITTIGEVLRVTLEV